jgi:polysaccharide export outer membrane protein
MPRESSPVPSGEVIVGDPHGLPHGPVPVGDPHGPVPVAGPGHPHGQAVPFEGRKMALPPYRIEPPDLLLIEFLRTENVPQLLRGQFLVGPDGSVNLGIYGSVLVGGLTIREARDAVAQVLSERIKPTKEKDKAGKETGKEIPLVDEVNVDVLAYNSKVYYVITDGAGYGAVVHRLPVNGSDTVLDALAQVGGLPPVASKKKIWVARANLGHPGANQILPVDWKAVALHAETRTNYQLAPGDRVYVGSDSLLLADSGLGKFLNPVNRVFGSLLLGGQTVNILRGTNTGFGNTGGNTVNNNISR